ncbi:MAG: ADP-ribosylglycohydrolase family protein [Anaerolineae bacterium]|nr:ADP-ribosylglycohydrolase family protein [Anaerolineae bacterium]
MSQNENVLISLEERFSGCILGGAIGDALGSSTEGRTPQEIVTRFGGRVEDFMPPYGPKPDGRHKGDGNITDDTLMILALCRAYLAKGGQLEAHDMTTYLVPEIADKPTWIPEFKRTMLLLDRLFYPERYLFIRLRLASANPREGGLGNMVNCGAAMYAAPVGLMNAGDPDLAYHRAIGLFSAHQYSYGLEAAAVMAACIAEAVRPSATIESVVNVALRLAKDGTQKAIAASVEAARTAPIGDETACQQHLRAAIEPFDTLKGGVQEFTRGGGFPSQTHSIEELPLALAYLVLSKGDYRSAVLGAINYGRDSDSIASMVGSIIGVMVGKTGLPEKWVSEMPVRNQIDFEAAARDLLALFRRDYAAAYAQAARRHEELMQEAR